MKILPNLDRNELYLNFAFCQQLLPFFNHFVNCLYFPNYASAINAPLSALFSDAGIMRNIRRKKKGDKTGMGHLQLSHFRRLIIFPSIGK